jgi:23S rRNA pseudouridine2605 synthase
MRAIDIPLRQSAPGSAWNARPWVAHLRGGPRAVAFGDLLRHTARVHGRASNPPPPAPRHGVARIISKLGAGSRSQAAAWVRAGRVQVNGRIVRDAEFPVRPDVDRIDLDGRPLAQAARVVLMLNKPRGLVTTARDERDRDTVYACLTDAALPWLAPVGRLDKASEGLLLFSNDPAWAARITDPASGPDKTYHVQIGRVPDAPLLEHLERGAVVDGQHLAVKRARLLRAGGRNAWLEVVLDEGRNRHIRRLLTEFDVSVLRLVRVAIGALELGALPKGAWRLLTEREIASL